MLAVAKPATPLAGFRFSSAMAWFNLWAMLDIAPEPEGQRPQEDQPTPPKRAAFYVDGFNFYHALKDLEKTKPHLKWLDWFSLAKMIAKSHDEEVCKVVICTAPPKHMPPDSVARHSTYMQALMSLGVEVKEGWFLPERQKCREFRCNPPGTWIRHTEKEGDVSLALSLIEDAYEDVFDTAYLVTSDGDQAPTLKLMQKRFGPSSVSPKETVTVSPVWRGSCATSVKLGALSTRTARISVQMLEKCLLPAKLVWTEPGPVPRLRRIYRPVEYAPPPQPSNQGSQPQSAAPATTP